VLPTKFAIVRRIVCRADNQKNHSFEQVSIVGVASRRGNGSKFIVASLTF
jgi:hypothetical protein